MTTHSVQPTATPQPLGQDLRAALVPGLLTIIAGAMQGDGAIISAAYRNASPISEEQLSYPWAGATAITTSLIWGITQVLIVVGLIMAGTATRRSGVWVGWRRFTPLVLGVWMVVMIPLQFTAAIALAVGIYALAVMALGLAMIQEGLQPALR